MDWALEGAEATDVTWNTDPADSEATEAGFLASEEEDAIEMMGEEEVESSPVLSTKFVRSMVARGV